MCGRYYRQSDKQKIAETFHVSRWAPDVHLAPDYNIAPSTFQPIIRSSPENGEREIVLMRWGLIPAKAADPDAFKIFSATNARAETILEKPIWKGPFQHSRCLVPVSGFYEWVRPESRPDDCPARHTTGPAVPSAVP
jgi:putative SOS response-associated peptidase YedK